MLESSGTIKAIDDTRLAWRAEGEGPTLLFCNGLANDAFQWGAVLRRLQGRGRLVTWDYPGHGRSEPAKTPACASIPALAGAVGKVLDAAGPEAGGPAVLLGYSLGCQVALEAWRTLAPRVRGVVLVLGTPGHPFSSLFGLDLGRVAVAMLRGSHPAMLRASFELSAGLAPLSHRAAQLAGITEWGIPYRDFAPWFEHQRRLDGGSFRAIGIAAQGHSAADLLPTIDVPTLVVAGGKDAFTPPHRAEAMDRAIPDSELVFLPGASHAGMVGHGGPIGEAVAGFLERRGLID